MGTIILIILVLLLVGALPTWPHSRSWGYAHALIHKSSLRIADPKINLAVQFSQPPL